MLYFIGPDGTFYISGDMPEGGREATDKETADWFASAKWKAYQFAAKEKLEKTDTTTARVVEAVVLGTSSFSTADVITFMRMRQALRAIVSASSGDPEQPLPSAPYPAGT